jgi:hypothetical protein
MKRPVRIQVRCAEETRREVDKAEAEFSGILHDGSLTHEEFCQHAATFIQKNKEQFRQHLKTVPREGNVEERR